MFTQVAKACSTWVEDRLEVLADAHTLISYVRPAEGLEVKLCAEKISQLDAPVRAAICRDHVFSGWIDDLRRHAIDLMAMPSSESTALAVRQIVALIELSLAVWEGRDFKRLLDWQLPSALLLPLSGQHVTLQPQVRTTGEFNLIYKPGSHELVVDGSIQSLRAFENGRWIRVVDRHFELFSDSAGEAYSIEYDTAISITAWVQSLCHAIDLVQCNPLAQALVERYVSYVVPLRQRDDTINLSFSARRFPNVVFKNNEMTPYLVGETLVHEADHQFFYAIEARSTFWRHETSHQEATYLSPWRDDPRPLDGVLRGLSAFARVCSYYSSILGSMDVPETTYRSVGEMLVRRLRESELAIVTLVESTQLTESGTEYVEEIRSVLGTSDQVIRARGEYDIWRSAADIQINAHRERWLQRNPGVPRA